MNVDYPSPKSTRHQRWNSLQVTGERDKLSRVSIQQLHKLRAVVCRIEHFSGDSVLARAIESTGISAVRGNDYYFGSRPAVTSEVVDDRLKIRTASGCENSDARLHAAILLLANGRSKTRLSADRGLDSGRDCRPLIRAEIAVERGPE